jgi:hypothetical protein
LVYGYLAGTKEPNNPLIQMENSNLKLVA